MEPLRNGEKANLQEAKDRREFWRRLAVRWKFWYWVLGVLAAVFAALGALPDIMGISSKYFAGISAAILAGTGFANPLKQFNDRMEGYWILDKAILMYPLDKAEDPFKAEKDLADSITAADRAANGQTYTLPKK